MIFTRLRHLKMDCFKINNSKYARKLTLFFSALCVTHFCFQLALHHIGIDGNIIVGDGVEYYSILRSVVMDKDLGFGNEYERFGADLSRHDVGKAYIGEGRYRSGRSLGAPIFWSPLFLLTHLVIRILSSLGANVSLDGFSFPYQYSVTFGTLVYVVIGLCLVMKTNEIFFSRKISFLSAIVLFMASSLIYYALIEASMAHGISFFIVAVFIYYCMRYRDEENPFYWILVGFFGGLAFLVRLQNIVFLIFPGYFALFYLITIFKKSDIKKMLLFLRNTLLCLLTLIVTISPQLLFWKILYGKFLWSPIGLPISFCASNFYIVLFSTRHGLFSWTPVMLPAVVGLFLLFKKDKNTAIALILCLFIQVYIYGLLVSACATASKGLGHAFGMRWLINCTPIFILGLASFFDWALAGTSSRKMYIKALFSILIVWNMLFVVQYKLNFIPADDYLSFKEIVLDKFTLPFKLIKHMKSEF